MPMAKCLMPLCCFSALAVTREAPVVLLKCDIEGSEEEALLGLGKALARVQRLAVEALERARAGSQSGT